MTKANFYDFHRSLQWAMLLIIANSSSSFPNFFTFKPALLLRFLFSFLQLPPIPQLRVGVQEYRYQIFVWFKELPIYTCVGNLPMFYLAAVPKNTFTFLCVWLWGWVGSEQHSLGTLLEIKTEAPTLKCRVPTWVLITTNMRLQKCASEQCVGTWKTVVSSLRKSPGTNSEQQQQQVYFSSIYIYFQKHRYQLNHFYFFSK